MLETFFQNRRVLITGVSGFIGSNLMAALQVLGADVFGVARTASGPHILRADVRDFAAIDSIIREHRISICFHLAAQSLVETGQADPYHTFATNINGTLNILESSRLNRVDRVIIASTAHVYGNQEPPCAEELTPRPSRHYETSKACSDLLAQTYANNCGLPVLIPRFVNVFGPHDLNYGRLIPRIMRSLVTGEGLRLWGGDAIRDFLYVDDAINAYLLLASSDPGSLGRNCIFNFGANNLLSVNELIQRVTSLSGIDLNIDRVPSERSAEIQRQYVTWQKAKRLLNWEPTIDLDDGLRRTIDWYSKLYRVEVKDEDSAASLYRRA